MNKLKFSRSGLHYHVNFFELNGLYFIYCCFEKEFHQNNRI